MLRKDLKDIIYSTVNNGFHIIRVMNDFYFCLDSSFLKFSFKNFYIFNTGQALPR